MPEKAGRNYNKEYYLKNKERILAGKRQRYKDDPTYRDRAKKRASDRGQQLNRKHQKKDASAPVVFRIQVSGKTIDVEMYTIAQLARSLGKSIKTLRAWERRGVMPKAIYRNSAGWCGNRLYPAFQFDEILKAFAQALRTDGVRRVENRISNTCFPELLKRLWEQYPAGIDTK